MFQTTTRGFTARTAAKLAAVALLATAMTACSSSSDDKDAGSSEVKLQNTTDPATGSLDLLKWGVPFGEPPTIDPAKGADNSVYFVTSNLCDGLLKLNPDYSVGPSLAKSWKYSDDNLSLTFALEENVKFSDGKDMTAEDVRYSLARHLDPKVTSIYAGSVFANVAGVKVTGDNAVTVSFKAPDSLFVKSMSISPGLVLEKAYVEAKGDAFGSPAAGVMCAGAYQLDKWSPGSGMQLSANPNYWNKDNTPHAKKVDLKFISDASALTQALQSGSLDGSYEVPPSAIAPLKKGKGKIYYGPSPAMLQIYPVAPGPMSDVKLRQAFSKLVDRESIAKRVYFGAAVANQTLVPEILWDAEAKASFQKAYDALDKDTKQDIEGAKDLIGQMDNPPKSLTLVVIAGNEPMRLTSTLLQQEALKVGIDIKIKQIQPADNAEYFTNPEARKGVDMIMNTGWSGVPDALFYPRRVVIPTGLFNLAKFDNPEVTQAIQGAVEEFDVQKRTALFADAQKVYDPAKVIVPLVNTREILYMRDGLTGATTSFAYVYSSSLARIGEAG